MISLNSCFEKELLSISSNTRQSDSRAITFSDREDHHSPSVFDEVHRELVVLDSRFSWLQIRLPVRQRPTKNGKSRSGVSARYNRTLIWHADLYLSRVGAQFEQIGIDIESLLKEYSACTALSFYDSSGVAKGFVKFYGKTEAIIVALSSCFNIAIDKSCNGFESIFNDSTHRYHQAILDELSNDKSCPFFSSLGSGPVYRFLSLAKSIRNKHRDPCGEYGAYLLHQGLQKLDFNKNLQLLGRALNECLQCLKIQASRRERRQTACDYLRFQEYSIILGRRSAEENLISQQKASGKSPKDDADEQTVQENVRRYEKMLADHVQVENKLQRLVGLRSSEFCTVVKNYEQALHSITHKAELEGLKAEVVSLKSTCAAEKATVKKQAKILNSLEEEQHLLEQTVRDQAAEIELLQMCSSASSFLRALPFKIARLLWRACISPYCFIGVLTCSYRLGRLDIGNIRRTFCSK